LQFLSNKKKRKEALDAAATASLAAPKNDPGGQGVQLQAQDDDDDMEVVHTAESDEALRESNLLGNTR